MTTLPTKVVFDNVSLRRGQTQVFDRLSLILNDRKIGLVGNNGSGKSSLLRLINGLLIPDTGTVQVGKFETRSNRRDLAGKIGFLFQNPEHQILFPTVGEELAFGLREAGMEPGSADLKAKQYLKEQAWEGWADRPVQDLSDGQKQRLCILSVLILNPKIILLDEPFASLDLPNKLMISDELMSLSQTLIMASHDLDLLSSFDRVIWLDEGMIVADGVGFDIVSQYREKYSPASNFFETIS